MPDPDYKALCVELVALDGHCVVDCTEEWADAMCRLRAALAQPEPEGPTDEELDRFADEVWSGSPRRYARAVLARWGTPTNNTRGTHFDG